MPAAAADASTRIVRFAPLITWALITLAGFVIGPPPTEPLWFVVGASVWLSVALVAVYRPWSQLPSGARVLFAALYMAAIAAYRHSLGGSDSGFSPLVLIPILWLGLYGTRRQLTAGFVVMLILLLAPIILVGGDLYPTSEWRRAAILACVAGFAGFAIQNLVVVVRDERERATARSEELAEQMALDVARQRQVDEAARAHLDDLDRLLSVARDLGRPSSSTDGRQAICGAARELADADLALFFELRANEGLLVSTGASGETDLPGRISLNAKRSLTADVFASGAATFVGDLFLDERVDRAVAARMNVRAAFWQPILRDGEPIGILVIYWRTVQASISDRVRSLLELFAAQATVVVERADLMRRLESLARTDPLTGLANRRALDEALVRDLAGAERSGKPLSLVMLDLDHFKRYNDSRGHQAGDALLHDAAVAWLAELRASDTMARFGGEEFIVVLPACDKARAISIADRLREIVPSGETASAGVATWDAAETMTTFIARADAALYEAKRRGRDRTEAAPAPSTTPNPIGQSQATYVQRRKSLRIAG